MKILFCWTHLSGYAGACFRELSNRPNTTVRVLHLASQASAPFDESRFGGFQRVAFDPGSADSTARVRREVREYSPDVLVISGWAHAPYRALVRDRPAHAAAVLAADTPARFDLRQRLVTPIIRRYLNRFQAIVVPGERGLQIMRYWGVPFDRLRVGLYGVDVTSLSEVHRRRKGAEWPRRFVFAGRMVQAKGVETLALAYRRYRARVDTPWPLVCCGTGPLARTLAGEPGVDYRGFLQPPELTEVLQEAGVFVLPSWIDPWPLALVEAAASGLPIVCTLACGSSAEVVRSFHNGLLVPPRDHDALASALEWFHHRHPELSTMGDRSANLAAPYSASYWADRWQAVCSDLVSRR